LIILDLIDPGTLQSYNKMQHESLADLPPGRRQSHKTDSNIHENSNTGGKRRCDFEENWQRRRRREVARCSQELQKVTNIRNSALKLGRVPLASKVILIAGKKARSLYSQHGRAAFQLQEP
jgi:hypothetical protein